MTVALVRLVVVFAAALIALAGVGAQARPVVDAVRFGADDSTTRVVLESDQALEPNIFLLSERGLRVVVDLPSVDWRAEAFDIGGGQKAGAGAGAVERFRFAQNTQHTSRFVLDLSRPAVVARSFRLAPTQTAPRHRLVIDLRPSDAAAFDAAVAASRSAGGSTARGAKSIPRDRDASGRGDWIVVIDAGHGGKDPGAVGRGRVREKDVTLAMAEALKAELEARGGYRVVMTRSDDRFIELEERVRIARQAEADLFLSLHADASDSGSATRGASVYTLSETASGRAKSEILSGRDWLIDVEAEAGRSPEVNDILVDLAQRETKNRSASFADILIPKLKKVGPVLSNTHRNAGFYVLLAPDVPAVLLEMGFLTNAKDEAALASQTHRATLANAVADAIEDYFNEQERLYAGR